jgi:hypothetical protein
VLTGIAGAIGVSLAGCTTGADGGTGASSTTTTTSDDTTTEATATQTSAVAPADDDGTASFDEERLQDRLDEYPTNDLTDAEISGLKFMREEEKLAHDLYTELGKYSDYPAFKNIADLEETHTEPVAALLEKYDLEDPVTDEPGQFANEELQSLYDSLLEKGQGSPEAALRVGAEVEEVDIVDIQERADATDEAAITLVYEDLVRGSRNHLRAFVSVLENQLGASYEPQHLSQDTYREIVESGMETGGAGGQDGQ